MTSLHGAPLCDLEPTFTIVNSVENNSSSFHRQPWQGRGPVRPLSMARAAILQRLTNQPEPLTLPSLVRATGLHENTVREHLSALVRSGLVRRERAIPEGRGRPPWLYEIPETTVSEVAEYAGLAAALASSIAELAPDPAAEGVRAGRAWGKQLSGGRPERYPLSADDAQAEVLDFLQGQGFAPEVQEDNPTHVLLKQCPLLEAAYRHPDVVCAVHLGIVQSMLNEYGADHTGTSLVPFAEPGACHLSFPTAS